MLGDQREREDLGRLVLSKACWWDLIGWKTCSDMALQSPLYAGLPSDVWLPFPFMWFSVQPVAHLMLNLVTSLSWSDGKRAQYLGLPLHFLMKTNLQFLALYVAMLSNFQRKMIKSKHQKGTEISSQLCYYFYYFSYFWLVRIIRDFIRHVIHFLMFSKSVKRHGLNDFQFDYRLLLAHFVLIGVFFFLL